MNTKKPEQSAGRPKSKAKRHAILAAASELFLDRGVQGTSMDAVADMAKVSKQTVYTHFNNKDDLFRAVIKTKVESYGFSQADLPGNESVHEVLFTLGRRFIDLLLDEQVVAMHRVVIGESAAQSAVAKLFYESGPAATIEMTARYFAAQMRAGRLKEDDPRYTAVLFLNMLRAHYQLLCLMGMPPKIGAKELDNHVTKVVGQFLELYSNG